MMDLQKYRLVIVPLCFLLLYTGCAKDDELMENRNHSVNIVAGLGSQSDVTVLRASTDSNFELYKTLNSTFVEDESHIFIDNPLQSEPFPDFNNDYYLYYYNGGIHNCTNEAGVNKGLVFDVFMPVSGTKALDKDALVHSPSDNNYRVEAVYVPGVKTADELEKRYWLDGRLYCGKVEAEQSTIEQLKQNDIMLAHNLTSVQSVDKHNHIHLHFWHSMAMLVINLGIPDYDSESNTGFNYDINPITADGCSLLDMILNFRVNYSTYTNSDKAIHVSLPEKKDEMRSDIHMCYLGFEEKVETVNGKDRNHHWYRYCALAPAQTKAETGSDGFAAKLCRFTIYDPVKKKDVSYIYRQNNSIMEQGKITILNLKLDQAQPDPILVSSEVLPWTYAYTTDIDCKEEVN